MLSGNFMHIICRQTKFVYPPSNIAACCNIKPHYCSCGLIFYDNGKYLRNWKRCWLKVKPSSISPNKEYLGENQKFFAQFKFEHYINVEICHCSNSV